jgi:hypothetical protein
MLLLISSLISVFPIVSSAEKMSSVNDILTTLNTRYQNTPADCDGKPAFYCSGIMLSVDDTWVDGDTSNDAASFSYLRHDMAIKSLYNPSAGNGYIFKDQQSAADAGTAYTVYCAFDSDANKEGHPDSSLGPNCGTKVADGTFFNSCADAGVTSVATWDEYMVKYFYPTRNLNYLCSFDASDTNEATIFINAYNTFQPVGLYNEVIVKGWYWSKGEIPPIEAFFYRKYSDDVHTESDRKNAIAQRDDFEAKTGQRVAVVEIDFNNFDAPFIASE